MARCTAPIHGHRSASAAENCPACSSRYSRSYYSPNYYSPSYPTSSGGSGNTLSNSNGSKSRNKKASWSSISSTILYTPEEIKTLTPVRENVEKRSNLPDLRDIFLCHAWDDRKGSAKELHDLLESKGVSVWFSEKDVLLGSPLMREIDRGLAKSKVGIVLVTPSFLERINNAGIADKELSALLARDLLIPIVHNTTYDNLRDVSPLLGSRSGLSTAEETMAEIAAKLAELVTPEETLIEA
ncbi:toll/interleukin-1 receptor domain-containing protein [Chryseobacterium nepalense]|uniref:Toll/interleukin-1 receptor domain-containing protein n=1 Tax=Chryseobacterium nepalense TaxID=1854498 RepID=A0ABY4K3Q4_9FLAO|nr:TIR domain-containing protein [Chryseobacterium nepalense]UPQ75414.1 toll/interleukin-1 receptor domain-containing protein [Chryseobacterium nepalense]